MACSGGKCSVKKHKKSAQPQAAVNPWNQMAPINSVGTASAPQSGWQKFKQGTKEFFGGTPAKQMQFARFNMPQQQAFQNALQQAVAMMQAEPARIPEFLPSLMNYLTHIQQGSGFDFAPIEAQARQGFEQKTIPSIAERFTALGAQRSSAFPQQLSQAASNLETNLAALRAGYGLDRARLGLAQQDLAQRGVLSQQQLGLNQQQLQNQRMFGLANIGLQPQFETAYSPRSPGFFENVGTGLAQGAGSFLPIAALGALGGASAPAAAAAGALGGGLNYLGNQGAMGAANQANQFYNAFTPSTSLFQT